MYEILAFIGAMVRTFLLPNPFETIQNGDFVNLVVSTVLHPITLIIVGIINSDGESWVGSFLYTVVYSGLTWLLYIWGRHDFSLLFAFKWAVVMWIVSNTMALFEPSHEEKYWGKKPVK